MNIEHDYLKLLKDVLENGKEKEDRTGTGTISVFGRQIRHDMSRGFPLLTTKKMYWKGIVTELLWFLRGDTNIKYLVDNDCHIWDGDAYKSYLKKSKDKVDSNSIPYQNLYLYGTVIDATPENPRQYSKEEFINKIKTNDEFANKWGDLGPVYGKQWADWGGQPGYLETKTITDTNGSMSWPERVGKSNGINQIQNAIDTLKNNPDSRRIMVSAWNVGELDQMTLPPCHYGFQVYTRELSEGERYKIFEVKGYEFRMNQWSREEQYDKAGIPKRTISLMWNQRSVDTFLGLPFNIASYGLLLEIIAKEVNMVPDELIGNLGDVHLYKNHIEQAKEQLTREPKRLPKVLINNSEVDNNGVPFTKSVLDGYDRTDFELVDYQSHPSIKAPLSN